MALKKSIENEMGIACEYWRVMPRVRVDLAEGTAHAHLMVWVSRDARLADKQHAHAHDFMTAEQVRAVEEALHLGGEDFTAAWATGDLRAAIYGQLKELDFFDGAEDVLEED